jgi:hypothetical protein
LTAASARRRGGSIPRLRDVPLLGMRPARDSWETATRPATRHGRSACKRASCAHEHWKTSGRLGRSSFCGDYRLRPASCGDFRLILARDLRGMKRSRRSLCQIHLPICRTFTGATGLEPATSGVTGRSRSLRSGRGSAGIPGISRASRTSSCGDCRAPAGTCGDLARDQGGMLCCPSCNQREVCGTRCSRQLGRLTSMRGRSPKP